MGAEKGLNRLPSFMTKWFKTTEKVLLAWKTCWNLLIIYYLLLICTNIIKCFFEIAINKKNLWSKRNKQKRSYTKQEKSYTKQETSYTKQETSKTKQKIKIYEWVLEKKKFVWYNLFHVWYNFFFVCQNNIPINT